MFAIVVSLFHSIRHDLWARAALHVEILALRHQLLILHRSERSHDVHLSFADGVFWVWLSHLRSNWRAALVNVKPARIEEIRVDTHGSLDYSSQRLPTR